MLKPRFSLHCNNSEKGWPERMQTCNMHWMKLRNARKQMNPILSLCIIFVTINEMKPVKHFNVLLIVITIINTNTVATHSSLIFFILVNCFDNFFFSFVANYFVETFYFFKCCFSIFCLSSLF